MILCLHIPCITGCHLGQGGTDLESFQQNNFSHSWEHRCNVGYVKAGIIERGHSSIDVKTKQNNTPQNQLNEILFYMTSLKKRGRTFSETQRSVLGDVYDMIGYKVKYRSNW